MKLNAYMASVSDSVSLVIHSAICRILLEFMWFKLFYCTYYHEYVRPILFRCAAVLPLRARKSRQYVTYNVLFLI